MGVKFGGEKLFLLLLIILMCLIHRYLLKKAYVKPSPVPGAGWSSWPPLQMSVLVFLFTFHGAEENGVIWTLTHSVLILNLTAGNGNNKLFCFRTSDVFRMRKKFPLLCTYTQRSRDYFHSWLPAATPEKSLSSLDQCCILSIENLCLTGVHSVCGYSDLPPPHPREPL